MSIKISEYIAVFDYFDNILIVLSATGGEVSIISFNTANDPPVGLLSSSFGLSLSLTTGIIKKLLQITRNKKKNLNEIVMLARSKLNSFEKLTSKSLLNYEISHEEYETIINEEQKT